MDGAMSSPVAQIGMPLAAGYAGSRGGAGGVNAALNTSQYLMRQAADKRVRDFFGEQGPYSETGQNVTAAGAGTTPPEASRVGDYMDELNALGAQGGMAAMPTVVRGLTSMNNTLTRYEQPQEVTAGNSLMSSSGELLGDPAPITDPHRIQGGNRINTITGDMEAAPLQAGQLAETTRYNDARISELGAREDLTGARGATEASKQSLNAAKVQKITAEIEYEIGTGKMTKEGLSLQLDRVNKALNDPTLKGRPEDTKALLNLRTTLIDRMSAVLQAEEATKGDSTEEGAASNTAEGTTVASHASALTTSPTGQVLDYVPGQGLRPR